MQNETMEVEVSRIIENVFPISGENLLATAALPTARPAHPLVLLASNNTKIMNAPRFGAVLVSGKRRNP
jgi:hypothetical protein